jgi:hypothetical protein
MSFEVIQSLPMDSRIDSDDGEMIDSLNSLQESDRYEHDPLPREGAPKSWIHKERGVVCGQAL